MNESDPRTLEIHAAALDALRNKSRKLRTRRLFVELKALKTDNSSNEWHEAASLVSVLRLARPGNVVGSLNLLRERATATKAKNILIISMAKYPII